MIARFHLLFFFVVLPLLCHGQSDWDVIQLEKLSFAFPNDRTEKDTLGQKTYFAWTPVGRIQFSKIPQPLSLIKNKDELFTFYKSFQENTIAQAQGRHVADSTTKIDGYYAYRFEFETDWSDTTEVHENLIVHLYGTIYSFSYSYYKDEKGSSMKERYAFFEGISINQPDKEMLLHKSIG